MTVFEKLTQPLEPILAAIETRRTKHANEQLNWHQFMLILVYFFSTNCDSRNSLVAKLKSADAALNLLAPAPATISEAFHRFPARLARKTLQQLLETV